MSRLKYLLPAVAFLVLAAFLLMGLGRDPREIPSPLVGKAAPAFELPVLGDPQQAFAPAQMQGQVWLLNVWASWCVPCLVEHPLLVQLARDKVVPIVGFNYKDQASDATAWLAKHGDPYTTIAVDRNGRAALDYGVYGVPETFLIDKAGTIRFKHVGPLTPEVMAQRVLPLVRELSR
jgi:cytochrome c biogenesis protein CcmG, thiol:disulfide interchange protein DsbE